MNQANLGAGYMKSVPTTGPKTPVPKNGSSAIKIRRARATDLPALIDLYEQLHFDPAGSSGGRRRGKLYTYRAPGVAEMRAAFRAIARNRDHQVLVATSTGKVIGTIHVMIFRHLGHGLRPVAIVENVVVDSTMRSRGVGEKIIEAAMRIARRNRCYKMSLTTNLKRRRAHRFYERLGWAKSHFGYSFKMPAKRGGERGG